MEELLGQLVGQLGIGTDQAKGGAGLLFKMAKEKLADADFGKISAAIGGVDELIGAAPEEGAASSLLGGLSSALGGKAEALGDLASLASGFKKLGLDADMIGKFVPVVLAFVQGKGGDTVKELLGKVLSTDG